MSGKMTDADRKEISDYRKRKDYYGYEDYAPSGRVALDTYNKVNKEQNYKDYKPMKKGEMPVSLSAAKKAQDAQREYNSEARRETNFTVPEEELADGGLVGAKRAKKSGPHGDFNYKK